MLPRTGGCLRALLRQPLPAACAGGVPLVRWQGPAAGSCRRWLSSPTMAMIKELREQTGAPIVDVKKALVESDCDPEEARAWLRKKGLASARKKAGRATSEGLVAIAERRLPDGAVREIAIVELCCETDFVARNSQFYELAEQLASAVLRRVEDHEDGAAAAPTLSQQLQEDSDVAESVAMLSATMGENIALRRVDYLAIPPGRAGTVAWYIHNRLPDTMSGQIVGAVALELGLAEGAHAADDSGGGAAAALLGEHGKRLAMQVVAASPAFATRELVPSAMLEAEKSVIAEECRASGKPEKVIEQMVKGKLNKWYEGVVLIDQKWVVGSADEAGGKAQTVAKIMAGWEKECGGEVQVQKLSRVAIGDDGDSLSPKE